MDNAKLILERIKETFNIKSNKDLSDKLGVSYNTLNTWIKRNSVPIDIIDKVVQNRQISFDWLLSGKNKQNIELINKNYYSIPIISLKASAGSAGNQLDSIDLFDETGEKLEVSKVLFKTPPKGTIRAMQVDGYSMIPMLYPDSWILFDESTEYKGDGLYVINWSNILMVKLLQVDLKYGKLKIISKNPDYESWELDLNEDQRTFTIIGKVIRCII